MIAILLQIAGSAIALFLVAPVFVVALASISSSRNFGLPWNGTTLQWYGNMLELESFSSSLYLSLKLAVVVTCVTLSIAIPASIALTKGVFRGRTGVGVLVVLPLMLPGVVVGIAAIAYFHSLPQVAPQVAIVLMHVVITTPYAVRIFSAALVRFDMVLVEAARTLGAGSVEAVLKVMVPALLPATLGAATLTFITSFDNYSIALFLGNVFVKPLPVRMLEYAESAPNPTLAAIATTLLGFSILATIIIAKATGLAGSRE